MVRAVSVRVGDVVRDRVLRLLWTVVDQDDDGTAYIQRNDVRSFTQYWNLDVVLPVDGKSPGDS
jgi:hypothetical protein